MVVCLNQRAVAEGAGACGILYLDFVPFDEVEMYKIKMQGQFVVNSLLPKPSILYWFDGTDRHPIFGNNFTKAMDKHLGGGRRKIQGEFVADFVMCDFLRTCSI